VTWTGKRSNLVQIDLTLVDIMVVDQVSATPWPWGMLDLDGRDRHSLGIGDAKSFGLVADPNFVRCRIHVANTKCRVSGDSIDLARGLPRVRRTHLTGGHARNACVARVAMDGHPWLERSRNCAAQWSHRACSLPLPLAQTHTPPHIYTRLAACRA
jgi:hypothetical protein